MTRRKRTLLAVGLLVAGTVGLVGFRWWSVSAGLADTWDRYRAIEVGMSQKAARSILEPTPPIQLGFIGWTPLEIGGDITRARTDAEVWFVNEPLAIRVNFEGQTGPVVGKLIARTERAPDGILSRLRRWLGF